MKILIQLSGGKDSQAAALWTVHESGFRHSDMIAITCDTDWEHEWTYAHIRQTAAALKLPLKILRSKKYHGIPDLAKKRGRFPSRKAQFCTEELKIIPCVNYILDELKEDFVMIRGIRRDESETRKDAPMHCTYFANYKARVKGDKKTYYRYKEAKAFWETHAEDLIQPLVEWSTKQVFDYIARHGQQPNPLYAQGFSRVGCFPCVNCSHAELHLIAKNHPEYFNRLERAENEVGQTFFASGKIPERYGSRTLPSGKQIATVGDVRRYVMMTNGQEELFTENEPENKNCGRYGVCE